MGGVGKTQIALQYATRSKKLYHTIIWLAADTSISLAQSVRDAAEALNLLHNEDELKDSVLAAVRLKKWLADSRLPWLLIFDNADDLEVLRSAWPTDGNGSVLLTSRDSSAPFSPASSGIHVEPFDAQSGAQVLLNYVGLDEKLGKNKQEAVEISTALGGLPLALGQIGGFISQRRMRLKDFMPMYDRNATAIHARRSGISDYEHTLSTVWSMSVTKLGTESRSLLVVLSFLEPDHVEESMLSKDTSFADASSFEFLQDEMALGDAEEDLLRAGLIYKEAENAVLSVHRLVQDMVIRSLEQAEKANVLKFTTCLLTNGFPDTHSADPGHQFATWASCEATLPHVLQLVRVQKRYKIDLSMRDRFAELLRRCAWYLYERELYELGSEMIVAAIDSFEDRTKIEYTAALALLGYIQMDLTQSDSALIHFEEAHRIRAAQLPETHPIMAGMYNDIGVAQTEIGDLDAAYKTHNKALEIRLAIKSDRVGNTYNNISALLLRMGKPDEAEETLARDPNLRDLSDETMLASGNPRYSGSMVLLSRIRFAQGRLSDATRLASKALTFRQTILGNGPKSCDSLFDVAYFVSKQGNVASAW
ncbi:Hypothetical protein D9617_106g078150 [Elsinoe fawcettii]|nr:Hypothetical protein D9617_106g078150 [Elsinoe fawcettii]